MLTILKKQPHIISFAAMQLFFSAPGQTFLIGIFVDPIFTELDVSRSLFAGIYSAATLLASTLLNPAGKLIDRYPLKTMIWGNSFLMALGCTVLALANNIYTLFLGFILLRLVGQGVLGLTGNTTLVKYFNRNRGKSLSLGSLGFPLSEMIYPTIALLLISIAGWRFTYGFFALSYLVLMLPLQLWLVHQSRLKPNTFLEGEDEAPQSNQIKHTADRHWTIREALKDVRFYLLALPASLGPIVMTALFFHQVSIFESNNWPVTMIAKAMAVYAGLRIASTIIIGPIIDRMGSLTSFVVGNLFFVIAIVIVAFGGPAYLTYPYLICCGIGIGISIPISNVIWPYFYGVKHMGSIKGFYAMVRNGLTALGPLPIALAIDMGISMTTSLLVMGGITLILSFLPLIAWRIKTT